MSANTYELTYFTVKGLGNMIRLVLEDQAVEYKFNGVTVETWGEVKPTTPLGQLPVLTVNGETKLSQSRAILRFLAREHGLSGFSSLEQGQIDMWIDQVTDIRQRLIIMLHNNYEEGRKPFVDSIPTELAPFEKELAGHESKEHLLFGKLTVADYALFDLLYALVALSPESLDSLTAVKAFYDSFAARERVAAFLNRDDIKEMKFTVKMHL